MPTPHPPPHSVLFPGGGVSLSDSGYGNIGKIVLQLAREVSESTVRNYVQRGVIKALRIGAGKRSTIRIPATEIKTLIGDTNPDTTES